MMSHIEMEYAKTLKQVSQLERELAEAKEQLRLCNIDQFTTAAELAELREELNDRRKFAYAVEQALDGLKGDYVEIIAALRKEWVGLTDADFEKEKFVDYNFMSGASFAEAKLREKNG